MNADDPFLLLFCVWRRIGWIGVDLFFVISGFLVSGLLFREYQKHGSVRLGRFFMRRAIRIYVPFYVFLVLSLPLVFYRVLDKPFVLAAEIFFIQSYSVPSLWNHTWSLAVEEHFYLFLGFLTFPLLLQGARKDPFRLFAIISPVLAVYCLLSRIAIPYDSIRTMINSHLRFDGLFFGVLISYFYHFRRTGFMALIERFRLPLAVFSALCFIPVFLAEPRTEPWITRFGLTFLYLGFGAVLALSLLANETRKNKAPGALSKMLANIGVLSYSLYLWHMPACEAVLRMKIPRTSTAGLLAAMALYLILAGMAGFLAHRWVEKPSLAWRDRVFPA